MFIFEEDEKQRGYSSICIKLGKTGFMVLGGGGAPVNIAEDIPGYGDNAPVRIVEFR